MSVHAVAPSNLDEAAAEMPCSTERRDDKNFLLELQRRFKSDAGGFAPKLEYLAVALALARDPSLVPGTVCKAAIPPITSSGTRSRIVQYRDRILEKNWLAESVDIDALASEAPQPVMLGPISLATHLGLRDELLVQPGWIAQNAPAIVPESLRIGHLLQCDERSEAYVYAEGHVTRWAHACSSTVFVVMQAGKHLSAGDEVQFTIGPDTAPTDSAYSVVDVHQFPRANSREREFCMVQIRCLCNRRPAISSPEKYLQPPLLPGDPYYDPDGLQHVLPPGARVCVLRLGRGIAWTSARDGMTAKRCISASRKASSIEHICGLGARDEAAWIRDADPDAFQRCHELRKDCCRKPMQLKVRQAGACLSGLGHLYFCRPYHPLLGDAPHPDHKQMRLRILHLQGYHTRYAAESESSFGEEEETPTNAIYRVFFSDTIMDDFDTETGDFCDRCGDPLPKVVPRWRCDDCQFDYCLHCSANDLEVSTTVFYDSAGLSESSDDRELRLNRNRKREEAALRWLDGAAAAAHRARNTELKRQEIVAKRQRTLTEYVQ